jgi:hypothetical protein
MGRSSVRRLLARLIAVLGRFRLLVQRPLQEPFDSRGATFKAVLEPKIVEPGQQRGLDHKMQERLIASSAWQK